MSEYNIRGYMRKIIDYITNIKFNLFNLISSSNVSSSEPSDKSTFMKSYSKITTYILRAYNLVLQPLTSSTEPHGCSPFKVDTLKNSLTSADYRKFLFGRSRSNFLGYLIILFYIIITIFTMLHHELWRDEAQAWCIVRDLSIFDIYNTSRIEGHPILWYLLIMPFAKLSIPVISMQIISLLLMICGVIFFVFKSPCNNFLKIAFIFSAGMLYYFPIIARNYSLIPILIFITANLYKTRTQHPFLYASILILLSNTHVFMLIFCIFLSCEFINNLITQSLSLASELYGYLTYNQVSSDNSPSLTNQSQINSHTIRTHNPVSKPLGSSTEPNGCSPFKVDTLKNSLTSADYRKFLFSRVFPILILIINFVFLFISFYNTNNINSTISAYHEQQYNLYTTIRFFANSFFIYPFQFYKNFNIYLLLTIFAVILGFFYKNNKKIFILLLLCSSFQFYICSKIWYGGIYYQKSFVLILIIMFCYWIYKDTTTKREYILTITMCLFLTFSLISSPFKIRLEYKYPFSGTKEISEYIKHNLNNTDMFYIKGPEYCFSGISAYLPDKKFFSNKENSYMTYYRFKNHSDIHNSLKIEYNPVSQSLASSTEPHGYSPFKVDTLKNPLTPAAYREFLFGRNPKNLKYYIVLDGYKVDSDFIEIYKTDKNIINKTGNSNEIYSIYIEKRKKL